MKSVSLTQGSVPRGLFAFAMPILYGNLVQVLNGTLTAFWVGRYLGERTLAALVNASSLLAIVLGGVFAMATISSLFVGVHLGGGRLQEAKGVVGTSTTFFTLLAGLIALVGVVVSEPVLDWMQTPYGSLSLAVDYARVVFMGVPVLLSHAFVLALVRGSGDSVTPFRFLLLTVVLDGLLNPLFLFGIGPWAGFGLPGSGVAAILAQGIGLIAMLIYLYRKRHPLCIGAHELGLLKPKLAVVKGVATQGSARGLQMFVVSFSGVLMIALVNRYGTDATAAYGATTQVWQYIQIPAFAIGMAASSMAAQNIGAQKWERVHAIASTGVWLGIGLTTALVAGVTVFGTQVIGLFLPDGSAALPVAVHLNSIVGWSYIPLGICVVLFGVVRANGAVMTPLGILFFALLLVRFPMACAFLASWQIEAIWWSFPVSTVFGAVLAIAYYVFGDWRGGRTHERRAQTAGGSLSAAPRS
jgi:putative MATE family efflux protein